MPSLPDATYDRVSFKASHNSYDREEIPVDTQLSWRPANAHNGGCRGLELDLQQSPRNWAWSIAHMGGYDGQADRQFSTYLDLLGDWSSRNPRHDPITVTLDLKAGSFPDSAFRYHLDRYILRSLERERIFTPGDLMGDEGNLAVAAKTRGWPKLAELRGRFIFCLSGNEKRKRAYARSPKHCLCFADQNKDETGPSARPSTKSGNRIFFNFKIGEKAGWEVDLKWYRDQPGFVTRAYVLNTEKEWRRALRAGINVLTSDKVQRYEWAKVGDAPFRKR